VDDDGTCQRILLEACNIEGSESALAVRLKKSEQQVLDWLDGKEPIPLEIFLQAIDIVIENQRQSAEFARFLQRRRNRQDR
jgi:hypothetical protein